MLAYIPLRLLKILFLIIFLCESSLMAMDLKDGHTNPTQAIHIKIKEHTPATPSDLIAKLRKKCEVFNTNETLSTYQTSEKVIKILAQESSERAEVFYEIMGYLETLLSKNKTSFFDNSWLAITSALTDEIENQTPAQVLTKLKEEMWQAVEVIKYHKTCEKEAEVYEKEEAAAMSLHMDKINPTSALFSLIHSKKNGNSSCSRCCQPDGRCAGGLRAWLQSIVRRLGSSS